MNYSKRKTSLNVNGLNEDKGIFRCRVSRQPVVLIPTELFVGLYFDYSFLYFSYRRKLVIQFVLFAKLKKINETKQKFQKYNRIQY